MPFLLGTGIGFVVTGIGSLFFIPSSDIGATITASSFLICGWVLIAGVFPHINNR